MHDVIKAPIEGEILSPRDMVRVVGRVRFCGARTDRLERPGRTVADYLARVEAPVVVDLVEGGRARPLPMAQWAATRPARGSAVVFRPRLNNGAAKALLTLAVVVAAVLIAGPAGGLLAGAIGISVSAATSLVAAGIIAAGTLALNALFPARPPQLAGRSSDSFTALNSIAGARNQANPYGPVPVPLGIHRQSPFLGALQFTELVGSDQYVRMLACLGYGPLDISAIKIGETPIGQFSDVETEIKYGYPGDSAVSLFPTQIFEDALSILLENHNAGAIWNQQTTRPDIDEFSVDVTAPDGIFQQDPDTGSLGPYTVLVKLEYREVGAPSWIEWTTLVFTRSTKTARKGARTKPAQRGQFEVRMAQFTGEPPESIAARTKDRVIWTALRSIRNDAPVSFDAPLAFIALRIRATDQLNGTVDTLNCITASKVTAYNGSSWVADTVSQNPADLFRHVLQCPANKRAVADSGIDLDSLEGWWGSCNSNGFKYNKIVSDLSSVRDLLAEIAAAGRAVPTWIDGKWGVIWDQPDATLIAPITPALAWDFSCSRVYATRPHGWRARFIDEDNGYSEDERIVYADGYSAANATLFEQIEFPGVTDADLVWRHGRFQEAQVRLRPEQITCSMAWQNIAFTRGDRVPLTWDVALIGLSAGRVKAVDEGALRVTLEELVTLESGKSYGIRFQLSDGTLVYRSITFSAEAETDTLTLVGTWPATADASLQAGNHFSFGEADQDSANYRVKSIEHQADLVARITLEDDAPDIALADQGAIPEYNPNITLPADPLTLAPSDLHYIEIIEGYGPSVRAIVRLSWQVARAGNIAAFEVQQRDDDTAGDWTRAAPPVPAPANTVDIELPSAGVWSYRVRCLFNDGTTFSNWTPLIGLTLQGLVAAPDDVTNLHQYAVDGRTVLEWTPIVEVRTHFYEVRKGTSWDVGLVVADALAQPPFPTAGDGTYHLRAYVLTPYGARIYSDATVSIIVADSVFVRNIIVENDEQDLGWPGELQGGVIDGSFVRTDTGETIAEAWAQEIVDQLALTGTHIAIYASPTIVDIGQATECRFWTEADGVGVLQGEDFLAQADFLGGTDVLGSAATRFIEAFPVWRFAEDGTADVFDPADVFDASDVFTGGVTWGNWTRIASGTRKARFFRAAMVTITNKADVDATVTKFHWFVDVPDRTDDYTGLSVPDTGLAVTFYQGGYDGTPAGGASALPFNGGPNGAANPHIQRSIINPTDGDEVVVTGVSPSGCTVHVRNGGANVARDGVELLVRGY